jgi:hypothetical protein
MKAARKRNISQRKMRRAVLPRHWQEELLRDWLNCLLDPAFSTALRSSDTNARLRGIRREIARLKNMDGCFVDEDGSFYTGKAVAILEGQEKHLLSERKNRTYECKVLGRTARKELGNVEGAERFGVSVFITYSLRPTENPYDVLQEDLETREVFIESKAIQMRVRRLERKIRTGQHMTWHQILQYQYRCYKYFTGINLWFSRFKGLPPVGYLRKCLTLTSHEMNMLESLVARAEILRRGRPHLRERQ